MAMLPYIAAVLLGVGAIVGATLAVLHLSNRNVPLWTALIHGAMVTPGLVILLIAVAMGRTQGRSEVDQFDASSMTYMTVAAGIFVLAAFGGLALFVRHSRRLPLPKLLILGHGTTAVTGYVILLLSLLAR